jgi:MGT family glycosyltransferase
MSKALFLSLPLHGHTNPTLPLVRELVSRGEEVVYYSAEPFADQIEQASALYRPYRAALLADMHVPQRIEEIVWLIMRATADVLDNELATFRAFRPDYVITDSLAPWGQWVGELLGVPVVTSISTFAMNRQVLAFGVAHGVRPKSARVVVSKLRHMTKAFLLMTQLRRRHRARGPGLLRSVLGSSGLNIVYTSRLFQPCADTFDDRYAFVGPSMADRSSATEFPWDEVTHPIVVYVSLGTLFNTDPVFYRNCFEAFATADCQVILAAGGNVSMASLGRAPPNFIVRPFVPQLQVLRRASAFVTHGGMNSVSESLYHCVPVVVIPHMGEQAIVGRRVEEIGAGLHVWKDEATPAKMRESVQRLLTEKGFREQAAVLRQSFEDAGGVSRATDSILAFTREGGLQRDDEASPSGKP